VKTHTLLDRNRRPYQSRSPGALADTGALRSTAAWTVRRHCARSPKGSTSGPGVLRRRGGRSRRRLPNPAVTASDRRTATGKRTTRPAPAWPASSSTRAQGTTHADPRLPELKSRDGWNARSIAGPDITSRGDVMRPRPRPPQPRPATRNQMTQWNLAVGRIRGPNVGPHGLRSVLRHPCQTGSSESSMRGVSSVGRDAIPKHCEQGVTPGRQPAVLRDRGRPRRAETAEGYRHHGQIQGERQSLTGPTLNGERLS
jgi:hypothetical protein